MTIVFQGWTGHVVYEGCVPFNNGFLKGTRPLETHLAMQVCRGCSLRPAVSEGSTKTFPSRSHVELLQRRTASNMQEQYGKEGSCPLGRLLS